MASCVGSNFRGVSGLPDLDSSPAALPGHRPALWRVSCFWAFDWLQISEARLASTAQTRCSRESRQSPAMIWASEPVLQALATETGDLTC